MPWGEPGDAADRPDRRNGDGRRLEDQLEQHRANKYAHAELVDRLALAAGVVQTENERRLSALEQFAARVVVLGIVGGILLGAVAGVVAARLLGALH